MTTRAHASPSPRRFTCPMHPDVDRDTAGDCPECGMALEPRLPFASAHSAHSAHWTCPMHPEIVRDEPGSCPICGMALEPAELGEDENPELADMTRRFWISLLLTVPVFALAMGEIVPGNRSPERSHRPRWPGCSSSSRLRSSSRAAGRSSRAAGPRSARGT